MTVANLPSPVHSYLRDFVLRRRLFALLRAVARAIVAAISILLLGCLVDRAAQLPAWSRAVLLAADLAAIGAIITMPLARLLNRQIDWLEAARDIEECNPAFTQRLQTVVSQLIEDPRYRGSPEILDQLLAEITQQAVRERPGRWVRWRVLAPSWCAAGAAVLVVWVLGMVPALGLPTLVGRFARPLAGISPVTTTRIRVTPEDVQVMRGSEQVITAHVQRLGDGGIELFTSQDHQSWTRMTMQWSAEGQYGVLLRGLERDIWYYVKGGDASTPVYKIAVLRPPAVVEYRIRYEYPPYVSRGALPVTNQDGLVEALSGTKVTLAVASTEPLKDARLSNGMVLEKTADPNVRQAQFALTESRALDLEMTSSAGVNVSVKNAVTLRPLPDRKPVVRLLQPFENLRLHPRDAMPIQYLATDDYGLRSLSVLMQVNGAAEFAMDLPAAPDPRRVEGQFFLDLASLNLHVGDVVRLDVLAEDGAGSKTRAGGDRDRERRFVLISPKSVDVATHLRIAELRQAAHFAVAAREELEHANEAMERSRQQSLGEAERSGERLKVGRAVMRAADATVVAHQSLLRSAARSESYQQTRCIAGLADRARVLALAADRLGSDSPGSGDPGFADRLRQAIGNAKELSGNVTAISEGVQAAAIVTERANLKAPPATQPSDRATAERNRAIQQSQREVGARVEELSLSPGAGDLDGQLQRRIELAKGLVGASKHLDFEAAAGEWSAAIRRGEPRLPPLPERLLSAAAVEALRPDSDPVRARDLQLAARAAERLMPMAAQEDKATAEAARAGLIELPGAVASLQREHRLNRRQGDLSAEEAAETRKSGTAARARLTTWAAQSETDLISDELHEIEPEDLAFQANLETARRSYGAAVSLDQRLEQRIRTQAFDESGSVDDIRRAMESVKSLDQLVTRQEELRRQSQNPSAAEISSISQEQFGVAQEIAKVQSADRRIGRFSGKEAADSRDLGIAAIRQADRQLDALLGDSSPQITDRIARQLRLYEPESHDAIELIASQVQPAVAALRQATRTNDRNGAERAKGQLREGISRLRASLAECEMRLVERDPIGAARWLAQAASEAFAGTSPDLRRARSFQDAALGALNRAWRDSVRDAGLARLSLTPSFRIILNAQPPEAAARAGKSIAEVLPAMRQWAPLRQRPSSTDAGSSTRETEPPTYLESLRLYFEAINRAQGGGR